MPIYIYMPMNCHQFLYILPSSDQSFSTCISAIHFAYTSFQSDRCDCCRAHEEEIVVTAIKIV